MTKPTLNGVAAVVSIIGTFFGVAVSVVQAVDQKKNNDRNCKLIGQAAGEAIADRLIKEKALPFGGTALYDAETNEYLGIKQ